jgi:Tfp pilus assembly protein PilF
MDVKPATLAIRVECAGTPSEALLAELDSLVERHPDAIDARFARAHCLEALGRETRARGAYQGVLAREPAHFGALTNLGTLYFTAGDWTRATVLYRQAVASRPDDPNAYVNLANALAEAGDVAAAEAEYLRALALDPAHPTAHFALSLLYARGGRADRAEQHREAAFAQPIVHVGSYAGDDAPIELLQLLAAHGGNIVTNLLFDDRRVRVTTLVADSWRPGVALPPHHVLFNAIGDADRSDDALERAAALVASDGLAAINDPARVRATRRAQVAETLAGIPGVIPPQTALLPRSAIDPAQLAARGYGYPVVLRAPGYHMGENVELVGAPGELAAALARLPGDELYAIGFLDARGSDGKFRKYRMLFVDGALYPVHLAISPRWKVHYFSADMRDVPEHRDEEARFLADPPAWLGPKAMAGLAGVRDALGLDYGGIDFGLSPAGDVLVYEANATMAIYLPDGDERFTYRRAPIERIVAAARAMFVNRAAAGGYCSRGSGAAVGKVNSE